MLVGFFFFFKQKTAYEMRISDWSSDVCSSDLHIYAQVIDDGAGKTLVAASSVDSALKDKLKRGADKAAAAEVGKLVAERAVAAGIKEVVFDRGGYLFHGRVKALADAAREGGLAF